MRPKHVDEQQSRREVELEAEWLYQETGFVIDPELLRDSGKRNPRHRYSRGSLRWP